MTMISPPRDVDGLAWVQIVAEAADREDEVPGLAEKLRAMNAAERVAVLERVEAYGRAEAIPR